MIVAITGTPGTGKSAAAAELSKMGHTVLDLNALIRQHAIHEGIDGESGSLIVDEGALRKKLKPVLEEAAKQGPLFVEGHLSHHLAPLDVVVVLRCSPRELKRRLEARGWPPEKVAENVEAEAVDLIAVEVGEARSAKLLVAEFDATSPTPEALAREIDALVKHPTAEALIAHPLGGCDWSDEVMSWY